MAVLAAVVVAVLIKYQPCSCLQHLMLQLLGQVALLYQVKMVSRHMSWVAMAVTHHLVI